MAGAVLEAVARLSMILSKLPTDTLVLVAAPSVVLVVVVVPAPDVVPRVMPWGVIGKVDVPAMGDPVTVVKTWTEVCDTV